MVLLISTIFFVPGITLLAPILYTQVSAVRAVSSFSSRFFSPSSPIGSSSIIAPAAEWMTPGKPANGIGLWISFRTMLPFKIRFPGTQRHSPIIGEPSFA